MTVTLTVYRHGEPRLHTFPSVKEAAEAALAELDEDVSFPHSICVGEDVTWRMNCVSEVRWELEALRR